MSRCQHGQHITVFCINDRCNWREAGGCQQCLKKYHSHSISNDTISQQKLQELFKKMLVKPDVKTKSRPLQEAIYNYFMIMKSQINSSLDAVSRQINNRLGYPFIQSQGQMAVFKKIKNRQYKKITKSQLLNFYKLSSSIDQASLEIKERALYLQQVEKLSGIMSQLNQVFTNYSKIIAKFDNSFNIEKTFYQKIQDLCSGIGDTQQKSEKLSTKSADKNTVKSEQTNPISIDSTNRRDRDRKVSLDWGNNWGNHYEEKQKQIEAKKKRLMNLLNSDDKKSAGDNIEKIKVEFEQPSIKEDFSSSKKEARKQSSSVEKNPVTSINSANLFSENALGQILAKGITDVIAHTNLPREASRKKLYEQGRDIEQRKIKIEVKTLAADVTECSSPILKKRRQKKLEEGLKLEKIESEHDKEMEFQVVQVKTPEKKEEQESIVMKDKEADSLALLVQSLTLQAEKAIPLLQAAIKYASNNLSAAEYLSYLYLQTGKPKQCLDLCSSILEQLEGSPHQQQLSIHISNNKAAALNMLGRYSESISILQKCITYSEKDIYYKNMADAYFSTGIYEKAIFNYEKALILNRNMDEALYNLAVCHYMQQHLYEAKLNVIRALKISPKNQDYNQLHKQILVKIPS